MTNHAIVSLLDGQAAKVRCRTCYGDHDFRNGIAPPTKRELQKQKALFNAVLANANPPAAPAEAVSRESDNSAAEPASSGSSDPEKT